MKNILKIFTALFMIAPFYGAMAEMSEYDECIIDINRQIFSKNMPLSEDFSELSKMFKKDYELTAEDMQSLEEQIQEKAKEILDTPATSVVNGKCNGISYTINIDETPRQKVPTPCHQLVYLDEQKLIEKEFAEAKCAHLKAAESSETTASSSNTPDEADDENNPANIAEPSVTPPPSVGNNMPKAPVVPTINLDDFYKKYCDNEGYYTDDTFKTPSYADFRNNCNAEEPFIIVSCYKWKNNDLNAITDELKHYCSTEKENRVEVGVGEEKRPKTHVKKDETVNTTAQSQQECTVDKIGNGATEVKYESDKCNIIKCDTNTYEEKPVNGKCVKKPSEKYKNAENELNKLMEQAKNALTKIKQEESK